MRYRDEYLDEVLRLDGRGRLGRTSQCATCSQAGAEYRCSDCLGGKMVCKACVIEAHSLLPLHRVQVT